MINDTYPRAKVIFINTWNMHCMLHIPNINKKHIGQGTSIWNSGKNHQLHAQLNNVSATNMPQTKIQCPFVWRKLKSELSLKKNKNWSATQLNTTKHDQLCIKRLTTRHGTVSIMPQQWDLSVDKKCWSICNLHLICVCLIKDALSWIEQDSTNNNLPTCTTVALDVHYFEWSTSYWC